MGKINTEGIPKHMLLALYARAKESESGRNYIYDSKAIEIVERLDYEFSVQEKNTIMGNGAIARTILLDKMVADYIKKNPDATIINIACGMDTRFYRVDNGKIHWYDLDLSVTIEARKRLLGENDRVFAIVGSALDETWADEVEAGGPLLIIVEGLTMYLNKQDVQKIFKIIRIHFKQAEIFMETVSPYTMKNAMESAAEDSGKKGTDEIDTDEKDADKDGADEGGAVKTSRHKYSWGIENGKQLQMITTGFKAVKTISLMEGLKKMYPIYHILKFFPPLKKISNKIIVLRREEQ